MCASARTSIVISYKACRHIVTDKGRMHIFIFTYDPVFSKRDDLFTFVT